MAPKSGRVSPSEFGYTEDPGDIVDKLSCMPLD